MSSSSIDPRLTTSSTSVTAAAHSSFAHPSSDDEYIDLDTQQYAKMDPVEALKQAFYQETGGLVFDNSLKKKGFALHAGFIRPLLRQLRDQPIEMHIFQNNGGAECYSLTRYWTITYKDSKGIEQELHFKKEIYTSVELPQDHEGNKQQQYIAALAARTYANIVESMISGAAGVEDDFYRALKSYNLRKIAKDRFVKMELYNNRELITVNPTHSLLRKNEIKERRVSHVQIHIRSGNKAENKSNKKGKDEHELEQEVFHTIDLTKKMLKGDSNKSERFFTRPYILQAYPSSSEHAKHLSLLSQQDVIFEHMDARNLTADEACAKLGLNKGEFQRYNQARLNSVCQEFEDHLHYFKYTDQLLTLMQKYGRDPSTDRPITIDKQTKDALDRISKGKRRFFGTKKPKDFGVLLAIEELSKTTKSDVQLKDMQNLMAAYTKAASKMDTLLAEIKKTEAAFDKMEIPYVKTSIPRQTQLDKLKGHVVDALNARAPLIKANADGSYFYSSEEPTHPAPVRQPPPVPQRKDKPLPSIPPQPLSPPPLPKDPPPTTFPEDFRGPDDSSSV